jgi:hypothetical protein
MFRIVHTRLLAASLLMTGLCFPLSAQNNEGDASFLTNSPAKAPSTANISKTDVRDISVSGPQSDSPFFTERQEAKAAMAEAAREGYGMYVPKPPKPPAGQRIASFFKGMFGSLKHDRQGGSAALALSVEPSEFSLSQTGELDVSLKITNAKKHEIEINYPNDQRLEVLTKDSSGNVITRWSEDRAFEQRDGFVAINPEEFVIYAERLSTAKMKAGETYTIEASLAGQEDYTAVTKVTPKP